METYNPGHLCSFVPHFASHSIYSNIDMHLNVVREDAELHRLEFVGGSCSSLQELWEHGEVFRRGRIQADN